MLLNNIVFQHTHRYSFLVRVCVCEFITLDIMAYGRQTNFVRENSVYACAIKTL